MGGQVEPRRHLALGDFFPALREFLQLLLRAELDEA
jgi:hypothetical protein